VKGEVKVSIDTVVMLAVRSVSIQGKLNTRELSPTGRSRQIARIVAFILARMSHTWRWHYDWDPSQLQSSWGKGKRDWPHAVRRERGKLGTGR
jgi:hypothetical protein